MNATTRLINIIMGLTCMALAIALQCEPASSRSLGYSSAAAVLSAPTPDADDELLNRPVPQIDFTDVSLNRVAKKLAEITSAHIYVGVASVGSPTVTIHLKNVTLGRALTEIVEYLAAHDRYVDVGVADGNITIGAPWDRIPKHTITEFHDIQSLINRQAKNAPSLNAQSDPSPEDYETNGGLQIASAIKGLVPGQWWPGGGDVGMTQQIGGFLAVTQTPTNAQAAGLVVDALNRASMSGSPVALHLRTERTRWPATDDLYFFVNLPLLLGQLPAQSHGNAPDLTSSESAFDRMTNYLVSPSALQDSRTIEVRRDCCNLLILAPPPRNELPLCKLFDAIIRARDSDGPSPIVVDADVVIDPNGRGMRTGFFNVRKLMVDLKARNSVVSAGRQVDASIRYAIPNASLNGTGGGAIYCMDGILGITQTPENILAVQRALEDLDHSLSRMGPVK